MSEWSTGTANKYLFFSCFKQSNRSPKMKVYGYKLPPNLGETYRLSNGVTARFLPALLP